MNLKTYVGKVFIVEDNEARLRQSRDLSQPVTYKEGDALPPGKRVGDAAVIPQFTEVSINDTHVDDSRTLFVLAAPAKDSSGAPFGWTKASNLVGGMINELVGLAPTPWAVEPRGDNYTVTDAKALLRGGPPGFASTSTTVPIGTFVVVTDRSPDGKFARVNRAGVGADGAPQVEAELGWTACANLTDGCSTVFATDGWGDPKGEFSAWERGRCIGPKVLLDIVGTGGALARITLESLDAYTRLKDAAAKDNVDLAITSGFRTFAKQQQLFELSHHGGNTAAEPGKSNHQHGQAFDLNTHGFDGTRNYDWLKKNGPKHGFIRTVNQEHWHWEYRPTDAAALRKQGGFKLAKVTK